MSPRTTTAEERLPSEATHVASRRGVVALLALTVALVALGNVLAAARSNPPWLSPDRRIIGTKFELLRATAADVLVLGDSSAAFGVNATVLAEELGASALNLATFGRFEVAGSAWTLAEYRRHHPAPRLVVAMHGARTWWLDASGLDLAQLPLAAGYWARVEPTRALGLAKLASFAVSRYVPLYTQHASFARGLRGRGFAVPERPAIGADGTMALGEEEARFANPEAFLERTVRPELAVRAPGIPARQRAAAEALAARAEAEGFALVFAAAPQWDALAAIPEHAAVVAEVDAFLQELAARSPRVHLVPGGPLGFPREAVENPYHLLAGPAEGYTRQLAAALRPILSAH